MHRALDPDWQLGGGVLPIDEGALGGGVRCLQGSEYNPKADLNRPSSAMQQCKKRNAPHHNHPGHRISWAFPVFFRLFYSRKVPMERIHMIAIRHFRDAIII
jgi:hypothetical protein